MPFAPSHWAYSSPSETPCGCNLLLEFILRLVHKKSPDLQYIISSGSMWVNILWETKAWGWRKCPVFLLLGEPEWCLIFHFLNGEVVSCDLLLSSGRFETNSGVWTGSERDAMQTGSSWFKHERCSDNSARDPRSEDAIWECISFLQLPSRYLQFDLWERNLAKVYVVSVNVEQYQKGQAGLA